MVAVYCHFFSLLLKRVMIMEKKTAKDVGGIGNADGKRAPRFDVLHGLMGFGEIQGNGVPLLHGAHAAFITFTLPSSL